MVGGIPTPLKNMKVNGKGYPIYEMESHVWNHKPDKDIPWYTMGYYIPSSDDI